MTKQEKEKLALQYIEILKIWAMSKNLKVITKPQSKFYPETNTITIKSKICNTTKLAHLIHECGHFISDQEYQIPNRLDTVYNRIIVLKDEILAWDIGFQLCKQLNLDLSPFNLKAIEAKCLKTYCSFVINPKKWKF